MPAMCCVTVGYIELLMPAAAGIKVVELLRDAVRCQQSYGSGGRVFQIERTGQIEVEYVSVKAGQVRAHAPDAPDAPPLALGHEPLKLSHSPSNQPSKGL